MGWRLYSDLLLPQTPHKQRVVPTSSCEPHLPDSIDQCLMPYSRFFLWYGSGINFIIRGKRNVRVKLWPLPGMWQISDTGCDLAVPVSQCVKPLRFPSTYFTYSYRNSARKCLKLQKGREQGTLANLKVVRQRSNVNGQVKVRFKAHEDFIMTVGKSYLVQLGMEHFGLGAQDSSPKVNQPPQNVGMFERPGRQKAFHSIMDPFVNKYVTPFQPEEVIMYVNSCW